MIDESHPLGEAGDRSIVGNVYHLGGDIAAAVGTGKSGLIPSCHDDPRALGLRQQGDRAGDPGAASDDHD